MERSCFTLLRVLERTERKIEKFQELVKRIEERLQSWEDQKEELRDFLKRDRRYSNLANRCRSKDTIHKLEKLEERLSHFEEDQKKLMNKLKTAQENVERKLNNIKTATELIKEEKESLSIEQQLLLDKIKHELKIKDLSHEVTDDDKPKKLQQTKHLK